MSNHLFKPRGYPYLPTQIISDDKIMFLNVDQRNFKPRINTIVIIDDKEYRTINLRLWDLSFDIIFRKVSSE